MKNLIITIATSALLFTSSAGFSQDYENHQEKEEQKKDTKFGIKGGVNFSNLKDKNADNRMRNGFNIGLFSKSYMSKGFSIQPEIYYTTKGGEANYKNDLVNGGAKFYFNYLEVPIIFMINLTDNFNIHFGPYASYLLSAQISNKSSDSGFDFEHNLNISDFNRFDGGLAAGLGFDIGPLSLGARYNIGITKVGKEREFLGNPYTFPDARNSVVNFYIAFVLSK